MAFSAELTFLETDRAATDARIFEILKNAKPGAQIDISTFIMENDKAGRLIMAALLEAKSRGAEIRFLIDHIGSEKRMDSRYLQWLVKNGIQVGIFNRPRIMRPIKSINQRNHAKWFIFDDALILGGRNIGEDYYMTMRIRNKPKLQKLLRKYPNFGYIPGLVKLAGERPQFRDKDVFISSTALAMESREHFDKLWNGEGITFLKKSPLDWMDMDEIEKKLAAAKSDLAGILSMGEKWNRNPISVPDSSVKIMQNAADFDRKAPKAIANEITALIRGAESEIVIENPYIILTKEIREAFEEVLSRKEPNKVKVIIYTNSGAKNSDVRLAAAAYELDVPKLLKMGIELREIRGFRSVHSKLIVVDRKKTFIGSFNLDPRSANINIENGIIVDDENVSRHAFNLTEKTRHNSEPAVPVERNPCSYLFLWLRGKVIRPIL